MKLDTKKLALNALFAVIALVIFIVESQIPLPFLAPGLKLGLANIVTLFVIFLGEKWTKRDIFLIFLTRTLLAALITGQATSLFFSFTGGFFAIVVMLILKKLDKSKTLPIPIVSVSGALAHNVGQVAAAAVVMRSFAVFAYLPVLIAGGVISGLLTGFAVHFIFKKRPKFINFLTSW
ncbi:MAG: Gx transporter family protein [Oscillospiraceae bacterium]|nr:Gx transporter family protein [Oscillospiraceae bacterium]